MCSHYLSFSLILNIEREACNFFQNKETVRRKTYSLKNTTWSSRVFGKLEIMPHLWRQVRIQLSPIIFNVKEDVEDRKMKIERCLRLSHEISKFFNVDYNKYNLIVSLSNDPCSRLELYNWLPIYNR